MLLVGEAVEVVLQVAVRLVEAHLLELLTHHLTLHFEGFVAECEPLHAVAFEPESGFGVMCGHYVVEVGVVAVGPGVVGAACVFKRFVKLGHVFRASKHQVLEKVGHTGALGAFVTTSYII